MDVDMLTNKNAMKVKCTYLSRDQDIGDATALVLHNIGPFIVWIKIGISLYHGSWIKTILGNLLLIADNNSRGSEPFTRGFRIRRRSISKVGLIAYVTP